MQNRYAGDIGDFSKFGLLRVLQASGLSIGLNWYLVPNESHNDDGRFVQYLNDERFRSCDEELWNALKRIVSAEEREVAALQNANLLDAVYYPDLLTASGASGTERDAFRADWHRRALNTLSGVDLVCVDPDNGVLVPSAVGSRKEIKYVKTNELADYYRQGASVVYYQHKARVPDVFYADKHREILTVEDFAGASGFGLKFTRTSLRYYFFIVQPGHKEIIGDAIEQMLKSSWGSYFDPVPQQSVQG